MRLRRKKEEATDVTITATEAQEQSQAALEAAREKWPAVKQVTSSLRGHRERNHFSEMIALTFQEKPR